MSEKTIVFATDNDIIKGAVGEITNEKDLDMRFEQPQPIKGGIYDTQIFGMTKKCNCRLVTHGHCPQCNVYVYDEDEYNKNYAYYQLHMPFIIRIKLNSLIDKLARLGITLPKVKAKAEPLPEQPEGEEPQKAPRAKINRDALINFWSLSFEVVLESDLSKQVDKSVDKILARDNPRILLDSYSLTGKDNRSYTLNIYELDQWTDISTVGPIGFKQLSWYSFNGTSLEFIDEHINSVLPLISPGLRNYTLREIGGKIRKEIPELSLEYKRIIWADQYVKKVNSSLNNTNTIDQATLCYLLNNLYDLHIKQADMLQTSKQATFRKNVGTRLGGSMRGNAMSYLACKLGEIYLPRALSYHALQKQIIDKIVDDYQREGYDALKMYIKMHPIAVECFEWIVDHCQVLLNRNPSLHRNNILQLTPKLWPDDTPAIGVNPFLCASYNLDFDGDQVAVYFITDPKELAEFGTSLRAENVWFFDKDQSPTYALKGDIIYGLYAATKDQPESNHPVEVDSFATLEKLYNEQKIEHDDIVIMMPNRRTTYAREKISQIIRKPLETILPLGKPFDAKIGELIVAGLWNHPERQEIMNELRDFGAEIATLVGVTNLPLANIYAGFSDKVQAVVDDPVLSDDAKLSKINAMLPKEIEKTMAALPNDNTEFLLKGSRIGKKTLEALYAPYVRLDEHGKLKVGDSDVIEGTSEEEYTTLAHSQRAVLEIKGTAVPRAGYNRTQLVLVSMNLVYRKKVSDDKSYVYFDEKKAKEYGYTFAKEAPPSKIPGLIPIYSNALSPDNTIYMHQVSKITKQITDDGAYLGITFSDALAEAFYQKELGLKYGGQLRQMTKEDIPALTDGIAEILPNNQGIKLGGYVYRLGEGIVPTEAVLKHQPIAKGDLIAINGNMVPIEKRFASFYTIFQLQVSGKTRTSDAYYNTMSVSYAPFDGVIHYKDDKICIDSKEIDDIKPEVTYFYPEGWHVKYGDRISGATLDLAKFLQFCDKEYAAYIFYKEITRILSDASPDLALTMYKVLINAGFSVKEKMRNQDDFVTRQLYGATTRGLETAIREGTDSKTLKTEIKLNNDNPILKLLLRSGGSSSWDNDD